MENKYTPIEKTNNQSHKKLIAVFAICIVIFSLILRFVYTPINNRLSDFFKAQADNNRIASLEKIDNSLKSMGDNITITRSEKDYKIIYTSLPAKQKDCSDLQLPALLEGWEYRCKTDKDYKNSDGTGWLPVNFTINGKKIIDKLPIHPINSEEILSFYFFIADKTAKDGYIFGDGFQLFSYFLSSTEANNENKDRTDSSPDLTNVKEGIKKLGTVRGKYVAEKANKDDKNPVSPNKMVFLSASSADTKCSDLNLPTLTKGWEYRCVTNAKSKNIDGSGWIPLDFYSDLLKRSIKELPQPNTNNEYQGLAFIMDGDNTYFLDKIPDAMLHIRSRQTVFSDEAINAAETRDTQAISAGIKTVGGVNENLIDNLTTLVYISLPSDKEDCTDLRDGLPSLPEGWEYRCAAKNNYKKADGTGWLPADLTKAKIKLSELPTDDTKNIKDLRYYAFVYDGKYALATGVKSKNILKSKIAKDQAYTPNTFVLGSSPKLWSDAVGLVAWWPMDEGEGDVAHDRSGNGNDGKLINKPEWVKGGGIKLNGKDQYITVPDAKSITLPNKFSFLAIVKPNKMKESGDIIARRNGHTAVGIIYNFSSGSIQFGGSVLNNTNSYFFEQTKRDINIPYHIYYSYDSKKGQILYINDEKSTEQKRLGINTLNNGPMIIGKGQVSFFEGEIDGASIYSRTFSANEIKDLFTRS